MKNLCLFLSMDAGLVSDTRLIYPLKIAESLKAEGRQLRGLAGVLEPSQAAFLGFPAISKAQLTLPERIPMEKSGFIRLSGSTKSFHDRG